MELEDGALDVELPVSRLSVAVFELAVALFEFRVDASGFRSRKLAKRQMSVADTAFSIAVVRSEEALRPAAERLFDDPYATLFAAIGKHAAESTQRYLDLPFFRDGVRLRTRFLDDCVREGLASGLKQVVLLGAGFDMRGLRLPEIAARGASVYEMDSPEQLARKREVLERGGAPLPAHVKYVPVDFGAADWEALLVRAGFQSGAGAMFVWEGVIGYIDSAAIDRSLRFIVSAGGRGTRLGFTYGPNTFDPNGADEHLRGLGFSGCRDYGGDELWRRYLPGEPYAHAAVMKVGLAKVG